MLPFSVRDYGTVNGILSGLSAIGIHGVEGPDLAKLLPADRMEASLKIMADVRGYFQGIPFHPSLPVTFFIKIHAQLPTNASPTTSLSLSTTTSFGASTEAYWGLYPNDWESTDRTAKTFARSLPKSHPKSQVAVRN